MSRSKTHVIKRKDGWAVKRQGSKRAAKIYPTQKEAVEEARKMSGSAEVIVHKRDGSVREWIKNK